MSDLNENNVADTSPLLEIYRKMGSIKDETDKLIDNAVEMLKAGAAFSGEPLKKVLITRFSEELGSKGVVVPLYIHPSDPSKTSVRAGKAGAAWLKDEVAAGKSRAEFLNPAHKDYQKYKDDYEGGNESIVADELVLDTPDGELTLQQKNDALQAQLNELNGTS